ncbi:MAG TPA: hypothetical protein PLW09_02630 [Candidatus Kapabacteria bacterium]|jgi:hypothetical protein|nr:hypothetical protein [Candidatus Kapabacteria bacterium]HRE56690.1 hypothetical protein [Candidatus Kapabacteria bacterium]
MKKILLIIPTILLAILTIVFASIFINRLTLPYNSVGNYFSETDGIVYHEQSVISYGVLTFVLSTTTIILTYLTIIKTSKKQKTERANSK